MMKNQPSKKGTQDLEASDRTVGAGVGGALLGASLGSIPGAIIGGIIGLLLAAIVNEEKQKAKKNDRSGGSD